MANRSLKLTADNQAFSLGRYQSTPWVSMLSNPQHFCQDRGRAVGANYHDLRLVGVAPIEIARFVFDATPLETAYRVCPTIVVTSPVSYAGIELVIDSEDTAGGNVASTTHTFDWTRPRREFGDFGQLNGGPESRLSWPYSETLTRGSESFPLGWFSHEVNAALPTQGRVLIVSLAVTSNDALISALSRGVCAVGYRA